MSTAAEPVSTEPSGTPRTELRDFVFPPQFYAGPDGITHWLSRAIPDPAGRRPDDLPRQQRISSAYTRAAAAGRAAPPVDALLAQPPALAALLARAAVADPAMFHILLVHYTLVLAPILASDPDGRSVGLSALRASLQSMSSFGSALMTESARSNSQVHLRTEARFDPLTREFVLHTPDADAAKFPNSAGAAGVPKIAAVYARLVVDGTDCGTFTFVVPIKDGRGAVASGVQITPAPTTSALVCDFAYTRFHYKRIPFHSWLSNGARIDDAGRFHDSATDPVGHSGNTPDGRSNSAGHRLGTAAPQIRRSLGAATSAIQSLTNAGRLRRRASAPRADNRYRDPTPNPAARLTRTMSTTAPHVWRGVIAAAAAVARESAVILHTHTADRLTMGRLAPEQPLMRYRAQQEAVLGTLAGAYALTVIANHTTRADRPVTSTQAAATWAPWSAVDPELPLLKAAATRLSADVITVCRARTGAAGFVADDRLNSYHGLVNSYFSAGGDNELILLDTAHAMTTSSDHPLPTPEPAPPPHADPTMPRVCLALVRSAERYYQQRLINGLAVATQAGQDRFTAWNDNLALARATGAARADRIVIQLLRDTHDIAPHPISTVLRYFLLSWVEQHAGSVTDQLLVAPHLHERIWQRRRALCDELVPHIPELVSALRFPDR